MNATIRSMLGLLLLLGAPGNAAAQQADHEFPAASYRIAPGESRIHVLVFRGGLLGGLGHDHVVSISEIKGTVCVAPQLSESAISLRLPLSSFLVDDSDARREEGSRFREDVPADDIKATRNNMLGPRLLDAAPNDVIAVHATVVGVDSHDLAVSADISIGGRSHTLTFPAAVSIVGERLTATGMRRVTHGELGLQPFSAAFGTLRVQKELLIRYTIVAVREPAEP